VTAADSTGSRRTGKPEFRRLRRGELWLLLIPLALGTAFAVLWTEPVGLAIAVVLLAAAAGFGTTLLPAPARQIVFWVVGFGAALGWGLREPALALAWLLIFPSGAAVGSHVRALRAQPPNR
jgi:hypothetical protein